MKQRRIKRVISDSIRTQVVAAELVRQIKLSQPLGAKRG